jgi:hypothetical protein
LPRLVLRSDEPLELALHQRRHGAAVGVAVDTAQALARGLLQAMGRARIEDRRNDPYF